MAKRPMILSRVLSRIGFLWDTANGTATPIINKKPGNIRSAGVNPFQSAWSRNQGGDGP